MPMPIPARRFHDARARAERARTTRSGARAEQLRSKTLTITACEKRAGGSQEYTVGTMKRKVGLPVGIPTIHTGNNVGILLAGKGSRSNRRGGRHIHNTHIMRSLPSYLTRIGISRQPKADLATLALIMAAHSRAIAFENFDVVMGKTISMAMPDVEKKLVDDGRGGYCWEQNTLLKMALEEMGFAVTPLMCRVRWGKPDDSEEPNTTFTHFALKVVTDSGASYLADVGFAGVNSMAPVDLGVGAEPQSLPEGQFRVVDSKHADFHVLELLVKGDWRPIYEWRDERALSSSIRSAPTGSAAPTWLRASPRNSSPAASSATSATTS